MLPLVYGFAEPLINWVTTPLHEKTLLANRTTTLDCAHTKGILPDLKNRLQYLVLGTCCLARAAIQPLDLTRELPDSFAQTARLIQASLQSLIGVFHRTLPANDFDERHPYLSGSLRVIGLSGATVLYSTYAAVAAAYLLSVAGSLAIKAGTVGWMAGQGSHLYDLGSLAQRVAFRLNQIVFNSYSCVGSTLASGYTWTKQRTPLPVVALAGVLILGAVAVHMVRQYRLQRKEEEWPGC
jgi:hypothetical protein